VSARRQRGRGKSGWRASLPHCGAPAAACGGERSSGAAARRVFEAWQWWAAEELGALGFLGRKAAAAAWGEKARAWHLNRAVHGALACGPGAPRGAEQRRCLAGLGLGSEFGSGEKTAPTGGAHVSASGRGEGEKSWHAVAGERKRDWAAGPRGGVGVEKRGRPVGCWAA
jgi:hypothetical protein